MDGARRADGPLSLTLRAAASYAAFVALIALVGTTHGADRRWTRLPELARQARLVVVGIVTRSRTFEDGRVMVAYIRPDRVLKGEAQPGEVAVVEEHDLPSGRTLLPTGEHVVAFLARAPRTSSLARALPAGPTYQTSVGGRMGVLTSQSAETIREAGDIVARWMAVAAGTVGEPDARAKEMRALALDEVAAAHPVVVEDGAAAVGALPDLAASLTDTERHRLEAAFDRHDLPPRVRVLLIRTVAAKRLTVLVPALRGLKNPPAEVLAASWDALRSLGAPPSASEISRYATNDDPTVRAVAAPALLAAGGADAVPQVERLALTDPDLAVRTAATKALGAAKPPDGLAALARIYEKRADGRQTAGNAIVAWGGDEAADMLERLAFAPPPEAQKQAVILLFAMGRKQDDPRIVRIRTTHPDPSVRELVTHGPDFGSHHH